MLATLSSYVKAHERLLIFVLGIILVWFVSGKIQDVIARHDAANLSAAQATLAAQTDANKTLAAQVAQQAVAFSALQETVGRENAALAAQNASLISALAARQKADNSLTLPELVTRWYTLVPEVKLSQTPTGLQIDEAGAHATVAALEQIPALTSQLANSQAETKNVNSLLAAATGQVSTLNDRVSGLILQQADSDKVCQAEIKVVKDAASKSKRRYFIAGFIAGLATRLLKF